MRIQDLMEASIQDIKSQVKKTLASMGPVFPTQFNDESKLKHRIIVRTLAYRGSQVGPNDASGAWLSYCQDVEKRVKSAFSASPLNFELEETPDANQSGLKNLKFKIRLNDRLIYEVKMTWQFYGTYSDKLNKTHYRTAWLMIQAKGPIKG